MKKKIFVVLLVLLVIVVSAITATAVLAAGPTSTTSTISISVIGPEKELTIQNPFEVKVGAISLIIPADGKIYAGDGVASVPLTITNVGRISYQININARPAKPPEGGVWPGLDVRIDSAGKTYYPWDIPNIPPGATIEMNVKISVAYGSSLVSFQGLSLDVWPGPTETSPEKE